MNKSKFLKKSLAALLAILMVAAMIPLSAAAAGDTVVVDINDEEGNLLNRDTITVNEGKLSGEDGDYTVTLPYDKDATEISITTDRKNVDAYSVDADGKETLVTAGVKVAGVPSGGTKTATIVLRDQTAELDAEPVATYTFTVSVPTRSGDTAVIGATYKYDATNITAATAKTVAGVVDGSTITFAKLPWGHVDALTRLDGTTNQVALTLANPTTGNENTFPAPAASPTPVTGIVDGKKSVTVTAQNGNTAQYDLVFVEEDCLTSLTIDGVEATLKAGTTDTYEITLDKAPAQGTPISVKTPKRNSALTIKFHEKSSSAVALTDANSKIGDIDTITDGDEVNLVISETATPANTKTYKVVINIKKNADPSVKSFTVNDGTYVENGVVAANGDLSAVLANGTNLPVNGVLSIKTNGKVKAAVLNGSVDCTEKATIATTPNTTVTFGAVGSEVSLSATNTIAITAEDGTTRTYKLSLSADPNKTTKPAITKGVLKVNTDSYTGTISGKTITFNLPASVSKADVNGGLATAAATPAPTSAQDAATIDFEWETTAHTQVTSAGAKFDSDYKSYKADENGSTENTDFFDDATLYEAITKDATHQLSTKKVQNTVTVKADGIAAAGEKWNIVFHQEAAEAGKRLTGFKFYNAAKQDKVTEENTYTAKIVEADKTVTVEKKLPYGLAGTENVVVDFALSKGASLWASSADDATLTQIADSGWKADGTPETGATVTVANLKSYKILVVADETLTNGLNSVTQIGNTKKWNDVKDDGHAARYTLKVETEAASNATDILSLEEVDGQVVSLIDVENGTVEVVVPETYVTEGSEKEFDLTIKTAPLVSSIVMQDADNATISNAEPNTDGVIEMLKVVADENGGYNLLSSDKKAIKKIAVTAENTSFKKIYTVTVTAKTLDTDNSLSGITVKDVAAVEGEENAWTVELPYGTDLEAITAEDVVATAASEKAEATVAKNEDGTYTITVKAENGKTADYTLTVTVAEKPDEPVFDDVPDWAQEAVSKAAEMGWMLGVAEGKFNPAGNIRRGDFALTIARILEKDWANVSAEYAKDVFADVKAGDWYYEAVAYVAEKGIMNGRANGFDPRTGITREEAAKVLCIALGLEKGEGDTTFGDDGAIAAWAKPYVKACQDAGIMSGTDGNFNPKNQLTRAETAQVLVNAFIDDEPEQPEEPAE